MGKIMEGQSTPEGGLKGGAGNRVKALMKSEFLACEKALVKVRIAYLYRHILRVLFSPTNCTENKIVKVCLGIADLCRHVLSVFSHEL